jgi:spore coat protein H
MNLRLVLTSALLLAGLFPKSPAATLPKSADELYSLTNIWSIHLTFTADEWKSMEPKGGGGFGPFGGGRGGFRGGFGGRPDPIAMLTSAFMREGDADKDQKISKEEFAALGKKWFAAWDTAATDAVGVEQLRAGLTTTLMRGGFARVSRVQGAEGQRNGIGADFEFEYVHANLEFEGKLFTNVATRYKGNGTFFGSRNQEKKPMKLDLNKFAKGQKLAGVATLNLHNEVTDASWMNDVLSYRLYRDAGVPAPRTAYARVNVTVPSEYKNEYFGLYTLVENIDEAFVEKHLKIKNPAVFKPVTPSLFSDLGEDWKDYNQTYDPKVATKKAKDRVIETCKFISKATDADLAARLGDYIDLDEFARYMAVTVWLSDLDGILGPGQNYYMIFNPKTQKFSFVAWDQDHSFGQMRGSQEEREELSIHKPWMGQNAFLERVFKVEAFKKPYLAALQEFSATLFRPHRFAVQVDQIAPVIRPAIKDEGGGKVEDFDRVVAGQPSERPSGFGRFGGGAKPIKTFVIARNAAVIAQLQNKSQGAEMDRGGFPGGRGGGMRGGFGGPGMMFADRFMEALDTNRDGQLTADEVSKQFAKFFDNWNTDKTHALTEDQLRAGITRDLPPFGFPR